MKRIKIFLASSIEDLREDRLQLGDYFNQLNDLYLDSGIFLSLIKCENYDKSLSLEGKQAEYDREIRESELVFFLFYKKVGDYTRHELEVALEAFQETRKPKIVTYFKYVTSIEDAAHEVREFMYLLDREMKHYYNTYGHIDTLKLGVLMQIKLLKLDSSQISLQDGAVLLNGHEVVKAENVPLLLGNQTLQELTEKRRQLQAELWEKRQTYRDNPSAENDVAVYAVSAELNRVSNELTVVERETMELLTTVAEITSDGRVLTHRQKEALKHFNRGDYNAALAILKDEERENELQRAENRTTVAKNEIQGYVEEELILIKTEKAQGITKERAERILAGYAKIAELVDRYGLEKWPLYGYAKFLDDQNQFNQAIVVAEKLQWYCADPSAAMREEDEALLHTLLGMLYSKTHHFEKSEEAYKKALQINTRLAEWNPDVYELDLAANYGELGILYTAARRYGEAEEACKKTQEIIIRFAIRNSKAEVYEPFLERSYNNLSVLYRDTQRYGEAHEACKKALDIAIRLATRNPNVYESSLASSYQNFGVLCIETHCYIEAEEAYKKALEIRVRLAERNPDAYTRDLASSYNNLGNLYRAMKNYGLAQEAHEKALKMYNRLAVREPDAFEPELANSYNNLGNLYSDMKEYERAGKAYWDAMAIYARLTVRNPAAYQPYLEICHHNLGAFYSDSHCREKAKETNAYAQELLAQIRARNPNAHDPVFDLLSSVYTKICAYQATSDAIIGSATLHAEIFEEDNLVSRQVRKTIGIIHRNSMNPNIKNMEQESELQNRCRELLTQAENYKNVDNYKKALGVTLTRYELICQYAGEDSEEALDALCNLTDIHQELGEYQTAVDTAEKSYELSRKIRGSTHPQTQTLAKKLIFFYKKQGLLKKTNALRKALRAEKGHTFWFRRNKYSD